MARRYYSSMRFVALSALLLSSFSCSGACDAPAHTMYSCEPMLPGTSGCVGGPYWTDDGERYQEDLDKIFPEQCIATIPDCSLDSPRPRSFICVGSGWAENL